MSVDFDKLFFAGLAVVPALLIGGCLYATRGRGSGLPGAAEVTAECRGEAHALARLARSAC
ncbi:MAG: hypothetical protein ACRDTD_32460 [Pseudonocardiaceae bacterium]